MTEAFVFDAIRTPRGKGKKDGSLYEVKPVNLLAGVLTDLQRAQRFRHRRGGRCGHGRGLAGGRPGRGVGQGGRAQGGLGFHCSGVQINRFCASGLEAVNMAAQKVRSGWEDLVVAGGVESMSRVPIGSDGGAWAMDPETNSDTAFVPQGIGADLIATLEGFTRAGRGCLCAGVAKARHPRPRQGYFDRSVVPVKDALGQIILAQDEFIKPNTTLEGLAGLKPAFEQMGGMGFDQVALHPLPAGGAHPPCAPRRQLVGHCRWRCGGADWLRGCSQGPRPHSRAPASWRWR